ncbi:MAG: hypothetical protein ACHREM_31320, partial [Polyangiales bacterium]
HPTLAAARATAAATPGFRSWAHNAKTGSVVIEYDSATVDVDDLLLHVAKGAHLRGVESATERKRDRNELASVFMDTVQDVNRVVEQVVAERADLRELVPIALAATSVVSFVLNDERGRLPEWSSALYKSYRVFMHWHRPEIRAREKIGREEDEEQAHARREGDDAR